MGGALQSETDRTSTGNTANKLEAAKEVGFWASKQNREKAIILGEENI